MGELNDSACRHAKPAVKLYRMHDMGGLYLEVLPSGRKTFRLSYRIHGKQRTLSIGEYPAVKLSEARRTALDARMAIRLGRDPKGAAPAEDGSDRFAAVAQEWFKAQAIGWKETHASRVWSRVERFLLPDLGERGIRDVTPRELLEVLRKIESPDSAKRARVYAGSIWTFAVASDLAEINPAIGLSKAMPKASKQIPRPALSADQLPSFFGRLSGSQMDRVTNLSIRLLMHTAVRPGELIGARWAEVSGDRWIIPAVRMKMERDHIVPLSTQALALLRELKGLAGAGGRFADLKADTMGKAINKLMGTGIVVPHGFRSTFSTIANDSNLWNPDAIERQLAHAPRNKVRAAYNRALHLEERAKLMQWYSDVLDVAKAKAVLEAQKADPDILI